MVDTTAQTSTMYSQLGALLMGPASHFSPTFWDKANIQVNDETSVHTPLRAGTQWNQTARFTQVKRATLTLGYLLEITISGSTLLAGEAPDALGSGAYVNNLGDQLIASCVHRYGSNVLQEYDGELQQIYQRLTTNEVNEEGRNALTLGGLPLSAGGIPELQRRQALIDGVTVYVPLDRLWFAQHKDEAWMPEAYATEGEIEITLARLQRVVYSALAAATTPFAVEPTITSLRLLSREVTLTIPEKQSRLAYFETGRGFLVHFMDVERQANIDIPAGGVTASSEYRIRLDNVRLDMQEIVFVVRRGDDGAANACIDRDWGGDPLQPPVYDFTVPAAPVAIASAIGAGVKRIDTMFDDVISFRLEANGKRMTDENVELVNRCWVRKMYHPDSQSRSPIYFKSFSLFPEDTKMISGYQNASNLGNLELVITMPGLAVPRIVDVWVHSHNVIQSRRGDVIKSLK